MHLNSCDALKKWDSSRPLLKPRGLRPGDTIGIFTPSSPDYESNEGLFLNGIRNLERLGFKVKLGSLTTQRSSQGYRSGTAEARANEFMELIQDDSVSGLMSTIGGSNSSSLIPFLDFDLIRQKQKIICGYSDVTSLHMAILKFSGLSTIYGPAAMCWFGDWPDGCTLSNEWFLEAVSNHKFGPRSIKAPTLWSNHRRRWDNGDWKTVPRLWDKSEGWRSLNEGIVEAPILALNLNTMLSAAGTPYWPNFSGRILLLEDMEAPLARTERSLRQLQYNGVFDQISGLIISKPENLDLQEAPFSYDDLFLEVIGPRSYPIVSQFDCGHTLPMISIPQLTRVRLEACRSNGVSFCFLEPGVHTS